MTNDAIPGVEFVDNLNQRTPCILVLDCSYSMDGAPIEQLNEGLLALENTLKEDKNARNRVQLMIIEAAGEVAKVSDWCDAIDFIAPQMEASGATPLGGAMELALDEVERQKESYKANGIPYTRPWVFLISDGAPTDNWEMVADRCRQEEKSKKVVVWPIGVENADLDILAQFTLPTRGAVRLRGLQFNELFVWLSQSLSTASASKEGDQIELPSVSSWATTEA